METIIDVKGMHCRSCELLIEDVLKEIDGIRSVSSNHRTGKVKIVYDNTSLEVIRDAIKKEGYEA